MSERKKLGVDDGERWLMHHPESDCVFEAKSKKVRDQSLRENCNDVTGIERYETWFKTDRDPLSGDSPLQIKYRPKTLEEIVGHKEIIKSIKSLLTAKSRPHAFLLTGGSGCGKTTIARILAKEFHCIGSNIVEIDAATHNGVEEMKNVISQLRYQGFGEEPNKIYIIDECHALSKAAWQALLKSVEEPPAHVYFAFCTTEEGKVPETIKTRCTSYQLKPIKNDDIQDLLEDVATREKLTYPKDSFSLIAKACNGSPRQALVWLGMIQGCLDREEVLILLEQPLEDKEIIDLCRKLVKDELDWKSLTETLKAMPEINAESIRIVIVNYLNSCLMNARSEKDVPRLLDMLSSFGKQCNPVDKLAPILLAFGNYIFPGD